MSINRRLPVVGGGGETFDPSDLEADISTLDGRVDTAESDINAVESTVGGHTTTLGTLGTTVSGHTTDIATLDGRVDTHDTTLGTLDTRLDDHDTDIDDINDDLVTVGNRLDSFDGISNIGAVGSTLTVTPGVGNGGIKLITLTDDLTISFNAGLGDKLNSLELVITQDATGGREVTWNETVKWPGGLEPILSTEPGAIDRIIFTSYDGGATWFGDTIGLAYA